MTEEFSTVVKVGDLITALAPFDEGGNVMVTIDDHGQLTVSPPPSASITLQRVQEPIR